MNRINNHLNANYEHRTTATNDLVAGFSYTFDKEDNKLYENRTHENKGDAFVYDAIYRLTGVKYEVPTLDPATDYTDYSTFNKKEDFTLDGVGNRIQVTNGATVNYSTNNLNQYYQIDSANLTYDLNGNLKSDGINQYGYWYNNQLGRVENSAYVVTFDGYDALGRRIRKTATNKTTGQTTTTVFYYDGARIIEERDGSDILLRQYIFGNEIDEILQRTDYNPAGNTTNEYYFHENSLGSIYAVTDRNGVVKERYKYTVYGQVTIYDSSNIQIPTSNIGNRFMFTGREYDSETGLYYYRARYYSATLGRFLQRDPKEDDNLTNLYTYVQNNPVNLSDPFGEKTKQPPTGQPPPPPTITPTPPITPTLPVPPYVKCDKTAEWNFIESKYKELVKLKNDTESATRRVGCGYWQTWIFNMLEELPLDKYTYDAVILAGQTTYFLRQYLLDT